MLHRILFIRPLIVSVFFLLFVDVMAMQEGNFTMAQKQQFLRENIQDKGYDKNSFVDFLYGKYGKKREEEPDVNNWTMEELEQVVIEFQIQNPLQANKEINVNGKLGENEQEEKLQREKQEKEKLEKEKAERLKNAQIQAKKEKNGNNNLKKFKNNISQTNKKANLKNKREGDNIDEEIIAQDNKGILLKLGPFFNGKDQLEPSINNTTNINNNQLDVNESLDQNFLCILSHNKIARGVFDFYRHVGKFLTSLVWSVVNSYCGFEQLVMNDWYCFKYAMCSGYRLQPRFMRSRVWIDMNFNFLEGIAGFLIRFFIFDPSYDMYENIFDFFNVCIDIKVYNNLYFAVNVVGIVRSIVLLSILSVKLTSPSPEIKKKRTFN